MTRTDQQLDSVRDRADSPHDTVSRRAQSRIRLWLKSRHLPDARIHEEQVAPMLRPSSRHAPKHGSLPTNEQRSRGVVRQVPPWAEVNSFESRRLRAALEGPVEPLSQTEHIGNRAERFGRHPAREIGLDD